MTAVRRLVLAASLVSSVGLAHVGDDDRLEMLALRSVQHPGDASWLRERAALLRRAGRDVEALDALRRAEAVGPPPREHLLLRAGATLRSDPTRALDDLDLFVTSGSPTAAALVARAEALVAVGRPGEAVDDLEAAFALRPEPDVAVALAQAAAAAGRHDRLVAAHAAALSALGVSPAVTRAVVNSLLTAGLAADAVEVAGAARERSQDPSLSLLHARALSALGREADARRAREDALSVAEASLRRRESALTRAVRARSLAALGRRAEAAREIARVRAAHPDLDLEMED